MGYAAGRPTVFRVIAFMGTQQAGLLFFGTSDRALRHAADRTTVLGARATDLWNAQQTGPLFYVH
jgi:hypothetical protein